MNKTKLKTAITTSPAVNCVPMAQQSVISGGEVMIRSALPLQ